MYSIIYDNQGNPVSTDSKKGHELVKQYIRIAKSSVQDKQTGGTNQTEVANIRISSSLPTTVVTISNDKKIKDDTREVISHLQNSDKPSSTCKYVLWVRHCESCSNVQGPLLKDDFFKYDIRRHGLIEPLCTQQGINQSIYFGKFKLKTIIDQLNQELTDKFQSKPLKPKFYSSVFPNS